MQSDYRILIITDEREFGDEMQSLLLSALRQGTTFPRLCESPVDEGLDPQSLVNRSSVVRCEGEAALEVVRTARDDDAPFSLIVWQHQEERQQPPADWLHALWTIQPALQTVVIGMEDGERESLLREVGIRPHLLFLREPFSTAELLQLTTSLADRASLAAAVSKQVQYLESQLLERMLEAEKANRAKSQFLANMSHEMRTPLSAMLGNADLLLNDLAKNVSPEQAQSLQTIRHGIEHLLTITNDILDLARVEAGKLQIHREHASPLAIIHEACDLLRVRAEEKRLNLVLQFDSLVPDQIETDATRLRQILINLIGNAIKFTFAGEISIRVSCPNPELENPRLFIDVADTGIGLTLEEQSRLFQPFMQAARGQARSSGGTGLGLAISRHLAHLLGGDIQVTSEYGRGSVFQLSIETGCLQGVRLLVPELPDAGVSDKDTLASTLTPDTLRGIHILLADDCPDNQRLVQMILRRSGAEVTVVDNGQQAFDLIQVAEAEGAPFDVLITDLQMPVVDGIELCRMLRRTDNTIPILPLTAESLDFDRQHLLRIGFSDYLAKPIDKWELLKSVLRHTCGRERLAVCP